MLGLPGESFEYYGGPHDGESVQVAFDLDGCPVLPERLRINGHPEGFYRLDYQPFGTEAVRYIWERKVVL